MDNRNNRNLRNLPYYTATIGSISVITYMQWLRDNPYSIARKELDKINSYLQLVKAIEAEESAKISMWQNFTLHLKELFSGRTHSHKHSHDDEDPEIIAGYVDTNESDLKTSAQLTNINQLSNQAYQAEIAYYDATCAHATQLVEDAEFLENIEKEQILSQVTDLHKALSAPQPIPHAVVAAAKKAHPAVQVVAFGGVPDPEDPNKLIGHHEIMHRIFHLLESDLNAACELCPRPSSNQLAAGELDAEIITHSNDHARRALVGDLLLYKHRTANAKMDYNPISEESLPEYRARIKARVEKWHNNPAHIQRVIQAGVDHRRAQEKLDAALNKEIKNPKYQRPTPYGTKKN